MRTGLRSYRFQSAARLAVGAVLALATLTSGVLAVVAFSAPQAANPLSALGFGAEERAQAAAQAGTPNALALNRQVLEAAPAAPRGWNRQAYLTGTKGFTPAVADALSRSYTVAPFGPTDSVWRLKYLYERWDRLPVELRRSARQEHRTHVRVYGGSLNPREITNGAGRVAAALNQNAGRRDRRADEAARKALEDAQKNSGTP